VNTPKKKEVLPLSFQIAIDGTVAAGKGTVSRAIAEQLGILYVDTGAMYRCVGYLSHILDISPDNELTLVEEIKKRKISLRVPNSNERDGRLITVLLNDEDVSWRIREEHIGGLASMVAQHEGVREELIRQQQHIASVQDVVMEGRDITHRVLPNAHMKIFLDALPEERARRRFLELQNRGINKSINDVLEDLRIRDKRDSEKNLKRVPGVWEIDTTHLSTQEVVNQILFRTQQLKNIR